MLRVGTVTSSMYLSYRGGPPHDHGIGNCVVLVRVRRGEDICN